MLTIELKGEVVCKKNNLAAIKINGKCRVLPMSKYTKYEKMAVNQISHLPKWDGGYPVFVEVFIYRKTRRAFDFDNMQATVNDVLVKAGIIEDDSMHHVIPKIDRHGWEVDKENPRAVVKIYPLTPDEACRRSGA